MECTYCNTELTHEDTYGRYLNDPQYREIHGQIYRCPNHVGFDSHEDAAAYLINIGETLDSLGVDTLEDVVCGSVSHNVEGSFYTDSQDNLHKGYPC